MRVSYVPVNEPLSLPGSSVAQSVEIPHKHWLSVPKDVLGFVIWAHIYWDLTYCHQSQLHLWATWIFNSTLLLNTQDLPPAVPPPPPELARISLSIVKTKWVSLKKKLTWDPVMTSEAFVGPAFSWASAARGWKLLSEILAFSAHWLKGNACVSSWCSRTEGHLYKHVCTTLAQRFLLPSSSPCGTGRSMCRLKRLLNVRRSALHCYFANPLKEMHWSPVVNYLF